MKKLYLIGGSGFIGKNLCRILSSDYRITVFDRWIDEAFFSRFPTIKTYMIDLVSEKIPDSFPTPHYMINLASVVTAERDLTLFDSLISSNLRVLLNLYERFKEEKNLELFVQFGSSEEYGAQESPFFETARESPNSPYALVKQLTVNTVLMLQQNYGFPAMVVRPGNLFGIGQPVEKFIPYVTRQLLDNKDLQVSPCEQRRDFIYADDFVCCVAKLLLYPQKCVGEIVNVSSGCSVALKEVIESLKMITASRSQVIYGALPYRENEIMDLRCSVAKLEYILNEKIDLPLSAGLERYVKSVSI